MVGRYRSFREANERALVVLSMRLSYRMVPADGEFLLCVEEARANAVRGQLEKFEEENRDWPPKPLAAISPNQPAALGLWCYVVVLCVVFYLQGIWPGLEAWGVNSSQAVFGQGQLWRPLTALLMHGDIAHLVGNLVAGLCLIWLVLQVFGNRLGWLLVILAGVLGNFLSAWIQYPSAYRALGASTAIFGALGLLVGHALAVGFNPEGWQRLRSRLVPLAAGMTVLALTGAGGERTDVIAHVTGFTMGVLTGAIVQRLTAKAQV